MMNKKERICPMCKNSYTDEPAISRRDNVTEICSDCGYKQALDDAGISKEIQEDIIKAIHGK